MYRWVITDQQTTVSTTAVDSSIRLAKPGSQRRDRYFHCNCAPLSGTAVRLFLGEPSMSLSE